MRGLASGLSPSLSSSPPPLPPPVPSFVLRGHSARVTCLLLHRLSPSHPVQAIAGDGSGVLRWWDLHSRRAIASLPAHTGGGQTELSSSANSTVLQLHKEKQDEEEAAKEAKRGLHSGQGRPLTAASAIAYRLISQCKSGEVLVLRVVHSAPPPSAPSTSPWSVSVTRLWGVETGAYGFFRSVRLPPVPSHLVRPRDATGEGELGERGRTQRERRSCSCQRSLLLLPSDISSNAHLVDVDLRSLCFTVECDERMEREEDEEEGGEVETKGGQKDRAPDAVSMSSASSATSASSSSTAPPPRYHRRFGMLMSAALYRTRQRGGEHWSVYALCGMESGHLILLDLTSQLHSAAAAQFTASASAHHSLNRQWTSPFVTRVAQLQLHSQPILSLCCSLSSSPSFSLSLLPAVDGGGAERGDGADTDAAAACATFLVVCSSPTKTLDSVYVHHRVSSDAPGAMKGEDAVWMTAAPAVSLTSSSSTSAAAPAAEGVNSLALRDDSRLLATAGWDHRVRIFRLNLQAVADTTQRQPERQQQQLLADAAASSSSSVVHRLSWPSSASHGGASTASAALRSLVSALFSASPPLELLVVLPFHTAPVQAVAFAPETTSGPEMSEDEAEHLDTAGQDPLRQLQPQSSPSPTSLLPTPCPSSSASALLPFSRLSSLRAAASSSSSPLRAWTSRPADAVGVRSAAVVAVGTSGRPSTAVSAVEDTALLASASEDQRIACWSVPLQKERERSVI